MIQQNSPLQCSEGTLALVVCNAPDQNGFHLKTDSEYSKDAGNALHFVSLDLDTDWKN